MNSMISESIEAVRCAKYIASSVSELAFSEWSCDCPNDIGIVTTQGFEERSIGFIEAFAEANLHAESVIVGIHSSHVEANARYQDRFELAAKKIADTNYKTVTVDKDGAWVVEALAQVNAPNVVLDITGIGTRGLFGALDAAAHSEKRIFIAYTEANEYWPKQGDWNALKEDLIDSTTLPDAADAKPWLFGYEHKVELIPGHDGYDSAGTERALVGFLPFKYARLAAVLSAEDYAAFLFIAGRPRLPSNAWRANVLREINREIIKDRIVVEISTFGYRSALSQICELLVKTHTLPERYDVHLALMGSKLQDVACWIFSCLMPSITVLTAVPSKYYPEAFSDGIGEKWVFPLISPYAIP